VGLFYTAPEPTRGGSTAGRAPAHLSGSGRDRGLRQPSHRPSCSTAFPAQYLPPSIAWNCLSDFIRNPTNSADRFRCLLTRSSAIADGPRDAMCQSKSGQLLHNNVGTTCTTSPEQIEVMELEDYSRPRYNKLVHSATTRSIVVSLIHSFSRRVC